MTFWSSYGRAVGITLESHVRQTTCIMMKWLYLCSMTIGCPGILMGLLWKMHHLNASSIIQSLRRVSNIIYLFKSSLVGMASRFWIPLLSTLPHISNSGWQELWRVNAVLANAV